MQCILSLMMLCTSDIFVLITYCSLVESFFIMISIAGVLWLRYKRPNMERPIKVCTTLNMNDTIYLFAIIKKMISLGSIMDTYSICNTMRFPGSGTVLWEAIRGWYGRSDHCIWYTSIFHRYSLEKKACLVPENQWFVIFTK